MAKPYIWPISAEEWGNLFAGSPKGPISKRRVEVLAKEGRILMPDGKTPGARKIGRDLLVHPDAPDPRRPPGRPSQA